MIVSLRQRLAVSLVLVAGCARAPNTVVHTPAPPCGFRAVERHEFALSVPSLWRDVPLESKGFTLYEARGALGGTVILGREPTATNQGRFIAITHERLAARFKGYRELMFRRYSPVGDDDMAFVEAEWSQGAGRVHAFLLFTVGDGAVTSWCAASTRAISRRACRCATRCCGRSGWRRERARAGDLGDGGVRGV